MLMVPGFLIFKIDCQSITDQIYYRIAVRGIYQVFNLKIALFFPNQLLFIR